MRHGPLLPAALVCCALLPIEAIAYVGPGAGLSALGSLLALVAAVFVSIVGFVWYPIRRLLRKKNKHEAPRRRQDDTEPK